MNADSPTIPKTTLTGVLFVLFLRLIAISCFWFGLQYWAMLVGYSLVGAGRFDLLSLPWKAASTCLAVLFPVAALGLWLVVSWGPVIWVLAAGAQISEYQPTMFHCKVFTVDGLLVSVGSTNFDNRSFRLNDEANLNIYDAAFAAQETRVFEEDLKRSTRLTYDAWQARPWREKALEHLSSLLATQL